MIVVTGASGKYGRLVVESLLDGGFPAAEIAVVARTPAKVADLAARGVAVRQADYDAPETLAPAFAGADKLLLVSSTGPNSDRIVRHRAAVAAARTAGVGLLAYTSIVHADTNLLEIARAHRDTELAITESGLPAILLRNGWYTENYTATLAGSVERGQIAGAARQGRIASATRADLAEAAAVLLAGDTPAGGVYELTGDTAWSLEELAAEASLQSGRQVRYVDLPGEQYGSILAGVGLPPFLVELLVDAEVKIAEGALAPVTGDLATLLQRPATPLAAAVTAALKGSPA